MERSERPWGTYQPLSDEPTFKVKTITVRPGHRLSYQRHPKRAEHWFVVSGEGVVTIYGQDRPVRAGDAVDIPVETAHRVATKGSEDLVFVEVQTGTYFCEDDTVRLDDDYGREG